MLIGMRLAGSWVLSSGFSCFCMISVSLVLVAAAGVDMSDVISFTSMPTLGAILVNTDVNTVLASLEEEEDDDDAWPDAGGGDLEPRRRFESELSRGDFDLDRCLPEERDFELLLNDLLINRIINFESVFEKIIKRIKQAQTFYHRGFSNESSTWSVVFHAIDLDLDLVFQQKIKIK